MPQTKFNSRSSKSQTGRQTKSYELAFAPSAAAPTSAGVGTPAGGASGQGTGGRAGAAAGQESGFQAGPARRRGGRERRQRAGSAACGSGWRRRRSWPAAGRAGGGGRRQGGRSWPSTLAAAMGEMRVEGERESTVRDKVPTRAERLRPPDFDGRVQPAS